MRAQQISELVRLGLSPEQIEGVLRWKEAQDEPRRERARLASKAYRDRQKNKSSTPKIVPQKVASSNVTSRHMTVTVNPSVIERHITSYDEPVKSLKVSRNSERHMTTGRGEGETYKEGGERKGPPQVLLPSEQVPSEPSAEASGSPKFPEPKSISTQQAQTKKELYAIGVELLGKRGGGMVSKLLKLYGDQVVPVAKIFADAAKAADPAAWVGRCLSNRQKFFDREMVARRQRLEWEPIDGEFPRRDLSHPAQAYYIPAEWDRRVPVYLDDDMVERKVMAQRLQNGRVYG